MELSDGGGGDGESAAKREKLSSDDATAAAGEDRLSALPNDLLVFILLKLGDTRAAAQTSVLSHRWRRVWAFLPKLIFFPHAVRRPHRFRDALDAHEVLIRDLIVLADGSTPESLAVWLPAAARSVSGKLTLRVHGPAKDEEEEQGYEQGGAFEFPCFEKATSISLSLAFQGLAVPPTGVFTRLTELHLIRVWFDGPGELGNAVSSPRCPCLQRLTVERAHGLSDLAIHSDSLLLMKLRVLHLSRLTVVAPVLKELTVTLCFGKSARVASISAPQLTNLDWNDGYDPTSVHLGKMEDLWSLGTGSYFVYGPEIFLRNHNCLSLLQRFENIKTLSLLLMYLPDIGNYQYMMEDMVVLPDITRLDMMVVANGHAFEASAFHVLRLSIGIRRLMLQLNAIPSEAQAVCSSDCICVQQPTDWETEELLLNHLEEVKIIAWRGSEHEVAFVKRVFDWGTKLKEMTVDFHSSISEVKAKELYQVFQSFSRPGVCTKFYLRWKLYAPKD